jgi:hypothetical protein
VGLLLGLPLAFFRGFAEQFSTPKFFLTKFLILHEVINHLSKPE